MSTSLANPKALDPADADHYRDALIALAAAEIPVLVGGGYALEVHTGVKRRTKDLDLFVLPEDIGRVLDVLGEAGYETELTYPHWLGKAVRGEYLIDVIFNSGNGVCPVDAEWFEHALDGTFLGVPVRILPAEEMLWQKAFIMERNRYDGADIAHTLRTHGPHFDWPRLLRRFGDHWRVLFAHLVLFGFIYPGDRGLVPAWVTRELLVRFLHEQDDPPVDSRLCRGTLLSLGQFRVDLDQWGYTDARLLPDGTLTREQIEQWTTAYEKEQQAQ